jgi:alkylation response protein AidB-like acyl-CoA dehydrogenase
VDLTLTDNELTVSTLAADVLGLTRDRSFAADDDDTRWSRLAEAGLLGVCVDEALGGLGLDFAAACLVLEQVGRWTGPVAVLDTLVASSLLRSFGGPDQHGLLAAVAAGDASVALALSEPLTSPALSRARLEPTAEGWSLSGVKTAVTHADRAECLLVAAQHPDRGAVLVVVAGSAPGLFIAARHTAGLGVNATVHLQDVPLVPADVLSGGRGAAVAGAVLGRDVAAASTLGGVIQGALALTVDYIKVRTVFGRPIGSFQATGQRLADAYASGWSTTLTAREAAWHLARHDGDAATAVSVAKLTAVTAARDVLRTAHHLHGGIGMDRDYPLHRFTTLATHLELSGGGETAAVERLGRQLARESLETLGVLN